MLYRVGGGGAFLHNLRGPAARPYLGRLMSAGPADYRLMTGSGPTRHIYGQEPRLSPLGDGGDGFSDVPPGDGQRRCCPFPTGIGGRRKKAYEGHSCRDGFFEGR